MHSIFIDSHGSLKGLELSCGSCLVDYRCENCDRKLLKRQRLNKAKCKEGPTVRNHHENVEIKISKSKGQQAMVTCENDCVREDYGSTCPDEDLI